MINQISIILIAYFVGSLSFGIIISYFFKLSDPRTTGSMNPGATNVMRAGNKLAALFTLLGDMLKGTLVITIANYMDSISILDLGTGSGCLLLAILSELPNAKGVGIDISSSSCKMAKKNAKELGLNNRAEFYQGNWMEDIFDQFDIIVTNPPYIAEPHIKFLDREIQLFEPHLALSGGPDGVSPYRLIAKESITRLKDAGILVVEIGINQAQSIRNIFIENGLKIIKTQRDFSNIERCILATVRHS